MSRRCNIYRICAIISVATIISTARPAQGSPPSTSDQFRERPIVHLTKERRIARNYELARKLYDAYVNIHKLGYADAFKAEDWEKGAEIWTFWPHRLDAENYDAKRRWGRAHRLDQPQDWKEWDRKEYTDILKVLPDWHIITPFKGFCDENGCAWQMNAGGHDSSGDYYEINEVEFMWTNESGRITRTEVYIDWTNMPAFMKRVWDSESK